MIEAARSGSYIHPRFFLSVRPRGGVNFFIADIETELLPARNIMQIVLDTLRGLVIIIFILKDSCGAHECFQCRSDEDDRCADLTPPDIFRKTCSRLSQGYCRKSTFTLYFTGQNRPIILRECAENADSRKFDSRKLEGGCYLGKYTRDSHSVTCECRGDFCNGSNQAVFSLDANVIVFQILLGWILARFFLASN